MYQSSKVNLLFVDDERDILRLLKVMFRREVRQGLVAFHSAESAGDAQDLLTSQGEQGIWAIITDINMPGQDGMSFFSEMPPHDGPRLRYLCTAYDRADYRERAKALGVSAFFKKPIDIDYIKRTIQGDLQELGLNVPLTPMGRNYLAAT